MKRSVIATSFLMAGLFICSPLGVCQEQGDDQDKSQSILKSSIALQPDQNTLYKDESGKVISREEFQKILNESPKIYKGQRTIMGGRVVEIRLIKAGNNGSDLMSLVRKKTEKARLESTESIGKAGADFTATTLDGKTVSFKDLKGRVIVLNFWFMACAPCVSEMPELNKLVKKYKARDDIVFIAPSLDSADQLNDFLKKHPFKYQIIPSAREFDDLYHVSTYPTHIIINRDGTVAQRYTGLETNTVASLASDIENVLAGRPIKKEAQ